MDNQIDYGQSLIAAFNGAAGNEQFHFESAAVDKIVAKYQEFIDGAQTIKKHLVEAEHASGFGGIPSAQQLQTGFRGKASAAIVVMDQMVDGALRLQEAYLRAARRFADADSINTKRIAALTTGLEGR